jgi:acyl dehydratase
MPTFDALAIGQVASLVSGVDAARIRAFAEVSGDSNPMHLDPEFGDLTRFGGPIAHGMLSASFISAVIGTMLPGPGAIYVTQSLRFTAPVRAGDVITARVEVVELYPERRRVRLATTCSNQRGQVVVTGEAVLVVDDVPGRRAPEQAPDNKKPPALVAGGEVSQPGVTRGPGLPGFGRGLPDGPQPSAETRNAPPGRSRSPGPFGGA